MKSRIAMKSFVDALSVFHLVGAVRNDGVII